ncbi:zinc transporter 10-like isoform X1 [Ananas comosus]|uniref:Zinc transporter 10-like isoform X1 n=1 Tax=Ananas comosus TaxID=4615 RepID=A0A6P5F899_ANACO|nr:zinc transporter 10-like isoform X1 [Ananas comosus]
MEIEGECRGDAATLPLKLAAIAAAIAAGAAGVAIPLARRQRRLVKSRGGIGGGGGLAVGRAIAAGAILAAGFVHALPAASASIAAAAPRGGIWSEFPLAKFAAMVAALGTLAIDLAGTRRHDEGREEKGNQTEAVRLVIGSPGPGERSGVIRIVGVHAGAAAHGDEEDASHPRHDVASDHIPGLGIASRSVIIGLSLGASQSPCVIGPLIIASTFHQFFEGFALGDCISQALFDRLKEVLMAFSFTVTTPAAIGIGLVVASTYNPDGLTARIVEGILNSITAGILIYFALINLIVADFLGNQRRTTDDGNRHLIWCYISLFLGAALVSLTALWD